ncbi:MAG: aldehyde ferredoxin oxidoreductase family protein [Pseudomonadota bacterium]
MGRIKSLISSFIGGGGYYRRIAGGFMKRYALIDLTRRRVEDYPVADEEMLDYLGGKGLAAHILLNELPAGTNPLDEDNILVINTGVLTGTGSPTSGRFNAATKSPLTGAIGTSNSGGDFGTFLKKAGYDGIVIRGKADGPVHIDITEDGIEILDAKNLWGLTTEKAQAALGKKDAKLVIGPAGENLVRFASIHCGHRVLGRIGIGAVMGSKHLKAITVSGKKNIPIARPDRFKEVTRKWTAALRKHAITGYQLPKFGTAGNVNMCNATRTLPVRNFKAGHHEKAYQISGETMAENLLVKNVGCRFCPIRCGRWVREGGKQKKGPEYETIALMGSNLENFNIKKIVQLSEACDNLGMDTISAGCVLGFAMELAENGKLDSELRFGRTDNLVETLGDIARRRGIGDELAEGTMRMAEKHGGADYSMNVKGLEMPGYEPRRSIGMGLGYATANRGGCHLNAGYLVFFEAIGPTQIDPLVKQGKAELDVLQQNLFDAISTSGSCIFTAYAVVPSGAEEHITPYSRASAMMAKTLTSSGFLLAYQSKLPIEKLKINVPFIPYPMVIAAATGVDYSVGDFLAAGERVYNLERMFNLREGFTRDDDILPRRMTHEQQDPGNPDTKVPVEAMLPKYYKARGWDDEGVPGEAMLEKLGLAGLLPLREAVKERMGPAHRKRLETRKEQDVLARQILEERGEKK